MSRVATRRENNMTVDVQRRKNLLRRKDMHNLLKLPR